MTAIGLVGRKIGMTRLFTEDGGAVAATVIEALPNVVSRIRDGKRDRYHAVQLTPGEHAKVRVNKPMAGHFRKAGVTPGRGLWELRQAAPVEGLSVGDQLSVGGFAPGAWVDVTARSKGKGFQGGVKRWNFHTQDSTHGNSLAHRAPGSIGQCQTPGRVWKGKHMAGHMGSRRVTVQSLEVLQVDAERNVLLVKGAVPGACGGDVLVRPAVKRKGDVPAGAKSRAPADAKSAAPADAKPGAAAEAKSAAPADAKSSAAADTKSGAAADAKSAEAADTKPGAAADAKSGVTDS